MIRSFHRHHPDGADGQDEVGKVDAPLEDEDADVEITLVSAVDRVGDKVVGADLQGVGVVVLVGEVGIAQTDPVPVSVVAMGGGEHVPVGNQGAPADVPPRPTLLLTQKKGG